MRQNRQGPDLFVDDVEDKLYAEVALLVHVQEQLHAKYTESVEQLRLLFCLKFQKVVKFSFSSACIIDYP